MNELFGIIGKELNWFKPYLTNREEQCIINDQLSSKKIITCGVPQGSILGRLLFLSYIKDLPETAESLKLTTLCIYVASPQTSFGVRLSRIHFSPTETWGRNECVTNEPQRTSAGRLVFMRMIHKSFASSHDANKLIVKLNSDLSQVRKWLIKNKLLNQNSCILGPPTV